MENSLFLVLKDDFIKCNHIKYHKHLESWVSNLTENQIIHFKRMLIK